jgi:hypothetical protein
MEGCLIERMEWYIEYEVRLGDINFAHSIYQVQRMFAILFTYVIIPQEIAVKAVESQQIVTSRMVLLQNLLPFFNQSYTVNKDGTAWCAVLMRAEISYHSCRELDGRQYHDASQSGIVLLSDRSSAADVLLCNTAAIIPLHILAR